MSDWFPTIRSWHSASPDSKAAAAGAEAVWDDVGREREQRGVTPVCHGGGGVVQAVGHKAGASTPSLGESGGGRCPGRASCYGMLGLIRRRYAGTHQSPGPREGDRTRELPK